MHLHPYVGRVEGRIAVHKQVIPDGRHSRDDEDVLGRIGIVMSAFLTRWSQ